MNGDAQHTHWSDPGTQHGRLKELPTQASAIPDALESFVIHDAAARSLGYSVPPAAETDRNVRTVAKLLDLAVKRDARPLTRERALADYLYGRSHDFALIATSVLRENGIPARSRVGYASYLLPGRWEDHWVCEHWARGRWAILDAELGSRARTRFGIEFDVSDVPETGWRSAASIWRSIRSGAVEADTCGVSFVGISGEWFVASAILRDAAALAGIECLPWDYWGPARDFCAAREVTPEQAREIDSLADALDPAPATRQKAEAVLDCFPWARPTPTILTFADGRTGTEVALTAQ